MTQTYLVTTKVSDVHSMHHDNVSFADRNTIFLHQVFGGGAFIDFPRSVLSLVRRNNLVKRFNKLNFGIQ